MEPKKIEEKIEKARAALLEAHEVLGGISVGEAKKYTEDAPVAIINALDEIESMRRVLKETMQSNTSFFDDDEEDENQVLKGMN